MAYVIRAGKLEKARPIRKLTSSQREVLKIGTHKQIEKLRQLKAKMAQAQKAS